MKNRILPMLLVLLLLLSLLTACGAESDQQQTTGTPAGSADTAAPLTEPADTTALTETPVETTALPAETETPAPETAEAPVQTTEAPVPSAGSTEAPETTIPEDELEPQPISEDLTERFTREDLHRINTFLSCFSELGFDAYEQETPDAFSLLKFGYMHLKLHDYMKIEGSGEYYYVSKADMDACLNQFFGQTVSIGYSVSKDYGYGYSETIEFRNDAYWFPAADGESYNDFTVVRRVFTDPEGNYRAEFDVYSLDIMLYFDNDGIDDSFYSMTAEEAEADERLEPLCSGVAVLQAEEGEDGPAYRLLEYFVFDTQ